MVRAAGLGVAVLVVATGLVQDRPLAGHREFDGSFAASTRIAAAAGGRQGVFVWDRGTRAASLFPMPVWLHRGQLSLLLPDGVGPADLASCAGPSRASPCSWSPTATACRRACAAPG